jgi:DNA-binding cell septation regulator SpoVG
MFLSSRSNFNDDIMRSLYKKYEIVINELNKIKDETNLFIVMKETKINNEDEKKTEKTKESKKTVSPMKKKKIKEFLFKTYEECISQKTSAPTYMSKQQIIEHIMKYEPDILDKLPKSFQNKKKSDICKVIFS